MYYSNELNTRVKKVNISCYAPRHIVRVECMCCGKELEKYESCAHVIGGKLYSSCKNYNFVCKK